MVGARWVFREVIAVSPALSSIHVGPAPEYVHFFSFLRRCEGGSPGPYLPSSAYLVKEQCVDAIV